jgi:hypothetical protein
VWKGGLGVWGGIAAGAAVGAWRVRRAGASVGVFMNAAAPALLIAQAVGRIGNYFNQELFGKPSSLPWALEISRAARPPSLAGRAGGRWMRSLPVSGQGGVSCASALRIRAASSAAVTACTQIIGRSVLGARADARPSPAARGPAAGRPP